MRDAPVKETSLPPIYVFSGGKGIAGDTVVQSILIQFPDNKIPIIIMPDILAAQNVTDALDKVGTTGGVIVHTMVDPITRALLVKACQDKGIRHFDLVGDLSNYIEQLLQVPPISQPGLYRMSHLDYFQRIESIEFTVKHDDGQHAEKIHHADIVLAGVSRTGKTPLSIYLAMFGWKVANVPLVMGIETPPALFEVDKNRVFGLTISSNYLIAQRANRVRTLKLSEDVDYLDRRKVNQELDFAERLFERGGFTVLDITNRPIESSANEILTLLTTRFGPDQWKNTQPY